MDGYLTAHWERPRCIKIVRTMWVRLIDLRGRRLNSEAVSIKYRALRNANANMGPLQPIT